MQTFNHLHVAGCEHSAARIEAIGQAIEAVDNQMYMKYYQ